MMQARAAPCHLRPARQAAAMVTPALMVTLALMPLAAAHPLSIPMVTLVLGHLDLLLLPLQPQETRPCPHPER